MEAVGGRGLYTYISRGIEVRCQIYICFFPVGFYVMDMGRWEIGKRMGWGFERSFF